MEDASLELLHRILETPSPSGYERPVQDLVRTFLAPLADHITTDVHGNVIGVKNADAPIRVMLAGHCDQIGLLVQHIDDDGFLYVQPIGGWDPIVLVGQRMTVWTDDGPIFGAIARKAIHLLTDEERKQVPKLKDLWLDVSAKDKDDASAQIRIGDPVTLALGHVELRNRTICSPGIDDKCGLWVVLEAFRRASLQPLSCALYVVSTVQEEIGLRGARTSAFEIDPHVGVAVDVTHATDCPTMDCKQEGDIKLGMGPVVYRGPNMNPKVVERLLAAAETNEIPIQLAGASRATGTDANAMQVSRAGVGTGLISIANRYMHSPVEMISLDDIDQAAELLAHFALEIDGDADFTP